MDAQKPPVFFSVIGGQNGSTTIDPMFLVQHGQIFPIPDPCSDTNPASIHFFKTFLSPGSKYHFIFGGTTAGTISVLRNTNDGDFPAKLNSTIKLQNLQMGLATNSEDFSRIGTERRSPTQSEVNLILRIAGKLFREHGVSGEDVRRMHAVQATIVKMSALSHIQIIATVTIPRKDGMGLQDSLFFVNGINHDEKPSFIWYHHSKDETDGRMILYVDQLNLSPQENEFVTREVFYENYRYQIFKKTNNGWRKTFETEIFGCL
jgi:hypothetical protein